MKQPPKKIYLQWHGSGDPDPSSDINPNDVSWCRDKIFKHDLVYVLKRKKRKTK